MFGMKTRIGWLSASLAVVVLTACGKQERVREVEWAKAALARNPALEILATDETAGVFTVRDTTSGSTYKVQLGELIAAPPPPKAVAQPAAPATAAPAAEPAVEAAPAEAAPADQTTETRVASRAGSGTSLAEGPGYSIARADTQSAAPPPTLEGPGYSITREGPATRPQTPNAEAVAANAERRTDPIICQGDRLMRIDGETIEFEGDAVIAENGCDLYISNARIRAGGVGIIARQARVHIVNSTIGGSRGSYEASEGAEIYVARSTFAGIGRRFDTAQMNDLGGNEYKLQH
jgi:hypothetical protein